MKNENITEEELLRQGIPILEELLERSELTPQSLVQPSREHDALIRLPMLGVTLLIQVKKALFPAKIQELIDKLFRLHLGSIPVVVTPRLTKGVFEACREKGLCVVDLTGNGFLKFRGFYYERFIEHRDSGRAERASGTPFTAKASRIVQAILDKPDYMWTQKELVEKTSMSQGYVSRTLGLLFDQGYLYTLGGLTKLTEYDRLLDDWVAHYRFDRHKRSTWMMSFGTYEIGIQKLAVECQRQGIEYAFTGWSGAFLRAPYGTSETIMAYVDKMPTESSALFPASEDGNVMLYVPQDDGVFIFSQKSQGFQVASDVQLYVDLARMPGRASDQAQVLREKRLKKGAQ